MVFLTQIPDPRKGCEVASGIFDIKAHRCGGNVNFVEITVDCMFSGHAVIITVITLAFHELKMNQIALLLIRLLALINLIFIVASRAHYSIDVIIAVYITVCNWFMFENIKLLNGRG
jgi:PAP2 superfamily C-terminal